MHLTLAIRINSNTKQQVLLEDCLDTGLSCSLLIACFSVSHGIHLRHD